MRRKLQQQKPIKGCNPQSYHAVTRILSLTAFDLLDFSSIRSLEQMFCTEERKEEFVVAVERERERREMQRKCNNARPPAQCQKTDCPSPLPTLPTPKTNYCPENSPSPPTIFLKKRKNLKVPTQIMCKYFIRFLNFSSKINF
jgi:hypothetical protein